MSRVKWAPFIYALATTVNLVQDDGVSLMQTLLLPAPRLGKHCRRYWLSREYELMRLCRCIPANPIARVANSRWSRYATCYQFAPLKPHSACDEFSIVFIPALNTSSSTLNIYINSASSKCFLESRMVRRPSWPETNQILRCFLSALHSLRQFISLPFSTFVSGMCPIHAADGKRQNICYPRA